MDLLIKKNFLGCYMVTKKGIATFLLLFSIIQIRTVFELPDQFLKNMLKACSKNEKYQFTQPSDFFKNSSDQTLIDFLQTYPEGFCGLLYRVKKDKNIDELFNSWVQVSLKQQMPSQSVLYLQADTIYKPIDCFTDHSYKEQFSTALLKENRLKKKYYCFYHGQEVRFGFLQELTTQLIKKLIAIGFLTTKLPDDFFFIQNPFCIKEIIEKRPTIRFIEQEHQKQKKMIKGRFFNKEKRRPIHRLATNAFLFANSDRLPSCTWDFVNNNSNINYHTIDYQKECFNKLNLSKYITQKLLEECQELESLYCQFHTSGRLLQIAIPKEMVDECAYLSSDGGYKDPVFTKDGKEITTVSEFFEHFYNKDFTVLKVHADQSHLRPGIYEVEFALPLTASKILNPFSGIKIFGYNPEPLEAIHYYDYNSGKTITITYQAFINRFNKLCSDIAEQVST